MDLEKYYDIYDVSDVDFDEAMLGYSDSEFEDAESLRVLKILGGRFHTTRKVFLCCLMALDAHGGKPDFLRWGTAIDEIHGVFAVTATAAERLRLILTEEESTFPSNFFFCFLTFDRFPCTSNTKNTPDSRPRTMASSTSKTQLPLLRNSRPPSQTPRPS
jgi:hypothetical protein